jgi:hypothetical protein
LKAEDKTNEITAVPELLDMTDEEDVQSGSQPGCIVEGPFRSKVNAVAMCPGFEAIISLIVV